MRTAALILGIIGGVLGIIAGIAAMMIGGIGVAFEAEDAGMIGGLGFFAIIFGIIGVVGGALANRSPKLAAVLELAAGLLGFIAVSMFWIPAGLCLLAGRYWHSLAESPVRRASSCPSRRADKHRHIVRPEAAKRLPA